MATSDGESEGDYSDFSAGTLPSVGDNVNDQGLDYLTLGTDSCRVLQPNTKGQLLICPHLRNKCRRRGHRKNPQRGEPGTYRTLRAQTRRLQGVLATERLTRETLQDIQAAQREINRGQAGFLPPPAVMDRPPLNPGDVPGRDSAPIAPGGSTRPEPPTADRPEPSPEMAGIPPLVETVQDDSTGPTFPGPAPPMTDPPKAIDLTGKTRYNMSLNTGTAGSFREPLSVDEASQSVPDPAEHHESSPSPSPAQFMVPTMTLGTQQGTQAATRGTSLPQDNFWYQDLLLQGEDSPSRLSKPHQRRLRTLRRFRVPGHRATFHHLHKSRHRLHAP